MKTRIALLILLLSLSSCGNTSESLGSNKSNPYFVLNYENVFSGHCPNKGKVKALVIPVHFKDDELLWNKENLELLDTAFNGVSHNEISCEWESVSSFYKKSSYQKLNFEFTITDLFTPESNSSFYSNKKNFNGDDYNTEAAEVLLNEALATFDEKYDFSEYDSDKDGIIDCFYMVYDHKVDWEANNLFWWAYTSKNRLSSTYDNLKPAQYVWCGFDFFKKDEQICNTHTLIHESAHLLGLDDYYDYNTSVGAKSGGLAGADLMDNDSGSPSGDHNGWSKSLLNWTSPKVITSNEAINITLKPLQNEGDVILINNSFEQEKGLYQEYLLLEYYTPTNLQEFDMIFKTSGLRILHICAQKDDKGRMIYDNTNSSHKLISQITSSNGGTYASNKVMRDDSTLFVPGEKLESFKFTNNTQLKYTIEVKSMDENGINLEICPK